jgi:hypothetical protein
LGSFPATRRPNSDTKPRNSISAVGGLDAISVVSATRAASKLSASAEEDISALAAVFDLRSDRRGLVSHQLPPIWLFHVDVQIPGVRIDFVAPCQNVNLPMTGHDHGVPVNRDLDVVADHGLIVGRPGLNSAEVIFLGIHLAIGVRVNDRVVIELLEQTLNLKAAELLLSAAI